MDENNDRQFLHIIKIMQRTNYVIPEKILESVKVCIKIFIKKVTCTSHIFYTN